MAYHLRHLARKISGNVRIPLIFAIVIEFISSTQILHIILKCIFKHELSTNFSFSGFFRELTSYAGAVQVFDPIIPENELRVGWFILIWYLILHIFSFGALMIIQVTNWLDIPNKLWNVMSILYLLHSRVLFFPIHYFLTGVIKAFVSCNYLQRGNFYCEEAWVIVTIIVAVLNLTIAGFVETFLYNVNKTKNAYAIKNNLFNQTVLIQKTLAVIASFIYDNQEYQNTFGAIVNPLLTLVLLYILFSKLPFYETLLMKIRVVLTGITMASAIILFISIFSVEEIKLEISWLLLTTLMAKMSLIAFEALSKSILNGSLGSPERAIHYFLLMKDCNFGHVNPSVHRRKYPFKAILVNGSFAKFHIDSSYIKKEKPTKEAEQEIYKLVMEKLNANLNKYQKSVPLLLFLAQISLKKLGNVSQAVFFVKKASALNLSITLRNSVEEFDSILKKIYSKQYLNNEDNLNLVDYFTHRKLANSLKEDIQTEIQTHFEFWQELQKQKFDVKRVYDLARQIDALSKKIQLIFKHNLWGFSKTVSNVLLIYRTYLERIQELPNEARKLLKKFFAISTNPLLLHPLDVYSNEKAVVVMSLVKDKLGTILDVSGSTQTMFQLDKPKIIGQSLNSLLPEVFAKCQIEFIRDISKVITHKINHRIKCYGKNQTGDLFELEATIQLYPDLEEGVRLMILFQKKSTTLPIIVVGRDGTILECSESLRKSFELKDFLAKGVKFNEICHEYGVINTAFNKVYSPNNEEKSSTDVRKVNNKGRKSRLGEESPEFPKKNIQSAIIEEKDSIMDAERVNQICTSYIEGNKLTFTNPIGKTKVDWEVQIEPYILGNSFYKVITLKNQDIFRPSLLGSSLEFQKRSLTTEATNLDLFADNFPLDLEREGEDDHEQHDHNEIKYQLTKEKSNMTNPSKKFLTIRTVSEKRRKTSDVSLSKLTIPSIPFEGRAMLTPFNSFNHHAEKTAESLREVFTPNELSSSNTPVKVEPMRQAMSVTSYTTSGAHAIKALKRVFSHSSTFPLARNSLLVCSFLILVIVILSIVFYLFSKDSINEYRGNVLIINGASQRISSSMSSLQAVTRFYLNSTGLGADNIDNIREDISSSASQMLNINNLLNEELSTTLKKSQFSSVYNPNVNLWEPCANFTSNNNHITTFQATSFLYSRYHSLREFPRSCSNIDAPDDLIYVMNNTVNDYLLSSENLISVTRSVLEESVDTNILNLELLLIGQSLVLGLLCVFLMSIIYILIQSYKRLLRALIKIDNSQVNYRIQELKTLKDSLEGDIEGKKFGAEALASLDNSVLLMKEQSKKKIGKSNSFVNRDDRFVLKSIALFLVKHVAISILFIILPSILFYASLASSISDFKKLDKLDDQLIVTSQLEYEVNLLMSNFYFEMMFENTSLMFIRNQLPGVQLTQNLQNVQALHEQLVNVFLKNEGEFSDALIEELLSDNLCSIFDESSPEAKNNCELATRGGKVGLVDLDVSYISLSTNYINEYLRNSTSANADIIVEPYSVAIRPTLETLISSFDFINSHLLSKTHDVTDKFLVQQEIFFFSILVTILLSAIVTYFLSIKRFREVDMGRGMILKMIPYSMITENRALEFYLKKDFSKKKYGLQTIRK